MRRGGVDIGLDLIAAERGGLKRRFPAPFASAANEWSHFAIA
jgi:hypothetical protein